MLLDAGAPKDLSNRLGWTALHEACFYNRMETVKTLLLSGANPTLRSRQGALPYHLACIPEIRSMLESMGGEGAGESIWHGRKGRASLHAMCRELYHELYTLSYSVLCMLPYDI